ncbi:MAG: hypothetical protein M1337_06425 [Actinobacteria bacterium]|nr:hypothetical protein [Actinomycetota bacterium]
MQPLIGTAKSLSSSEQQCLDGRDTRSHRRSDLGVTHPVQFPERQRQALLRGQRHHRTPDVQTELLAFGRWLRRAVGVRIGHHLPHRFFSVRMDGGVPLSLAQLVRTDIGSDATQPSADCCRIAHIVKTGERTDERLLGNVLGVLTTTQGAIRQVIDSGVVAIDELLGGQSARRGARRVSSAGHVRLHPHGLSPAVMRIILSGSGVRYPPTRLG